MVVGGVSALMKGTGGVDEVVAGAGAVLMSGTVGKHIGGEGGHEMVVGGCTALTSGTGGRGNGGIGVGCAVLVSSEGGGHQVVVDGVGSRAVGGIAVVEDMVVSTHVGETTQCGQVVEQLAKLCGVFCH